MDFFKSFSTPTEAPKADETPKTEDKGIFGGFFSTPAPAATPEPASTEPQQDVGTMIGNFFSSVATTANQAVADVQAKIAESQQPQPVSTEPQGPSVGEQVSGFFSNLKTSIDEGIAAALPKAEQQPSQKEANAHIKHFGDLPETCKKPEIGKYYPQELRDELFDDEWEIFQELKKLEVSQHFEDRFLCACLFSRKLDLKRTEEMLTKNLQWRTENNFLEVPKWETLPKEMMFHDFALKVPGTRGLNGEGIIYVKMGNMKPAEIQGFVDGCVLWTVWNGMKGGLLESMDYHRNGLIIVSDLTGMGWHNVDMELQRRMNDALLDSFPMRVTKIIILNPPWMVGAFLEGLRLFIKKKVMDRIGVMEDRAHLLEFISKENLSTDFGGDLKYGMQDWFNFIEAQ
jgi:hypothetical protein